MIILLAANYPDYIPRKDTKFNDWQQQFVGYITGKLAAFGIAPLNPDWTALLGLQGDWTTKYAAGNKFSDRKRSDTIAKQKQRLIYERALRRFYKSYITYNAAVTNEDRANMNVTIPDAVRTKDPAPHYAPQGSVHKIIHEMHELRIVDPTHPETKEMPHGWHVEVWVSITPPVAPSAEPPDGSFYFVGNASKFHYNIPWTENFGLTAYYYLLYENTHGAVGPKSAIFSAVIA